MTVIDDTAADFAQGSPTDTVVRTPAGENGSVESARTLEEQFNGAPWTSSQWGSGGTASVADGSMLVDGARADSGVSTGPGASLEFTATFGTEQFQHVGFGTDFDAEPWAMFSTGSAGGGKVFARISDGAGGAADIDVDVGDLAGQPHRYRIDWTAGGFAFFVDDELVTIPPASLTNTMRVQASDLTVGGGGVAIDSISLNTHKTSGTFTSRPLDAGDARVTALAFTPTGDTPANTAIAYATRTADTAAGLDSAAWVDLTGGAVAGSPKRYLQYRATLSTIDPAATPRLDKVVVGFTIDDEAPVVTIDDVAVAGATAKVGFRAEAGSTVRCKLDDNAFGACTSPAEFGGLTDGSHEIEVEAADNVGNVRSAGKTFVVDTTAPKVTISNLAVSGGSAKVTFGASEQAAFACKVDGGAFRSCTSPATFSGLAAGSHAIVVRGTDTHGNAGAATRAFDIKPPAGGTSPPPGGVTAPDLTAPEVLVTRRSVRVSKSGFAKVRVTCPATEPSCAVAVTLKLHGKRIARKTTTLASGKTRALRLRLSSAARTALAARARLKLTAVVVAGDAAGNRKTKRFRITLRAPRA